MALEHTAWRLVGMEITDGAGGAGQIDLSAAARPLTLAFHAEEGRRRALAGFGGCNRYQADYTLAGEALTVRTIASTRRACSPDAMALEARYFDLLEHAVRLGVDEGTLTVSVPGGILRFTRAEHA